LRNVVLTPPASRTRARAALARAVERFSGEVEEVPLRQRARRLREIAADPDVEWIAVIDADVVLAAESFGSFRRAAGRGTALVGGRAVVGSTQRLGAMFGPSRSGPNPFDLVPLMAPQEDRQFADLVRGPVDVPERGAYAVSAAFVRELAEVDLDPIALHLDLAVHARALGHDVVCEPVLTFSAGEDSAELRRALVNLRRFASAGTWDPHQLHRDPPQMRSVCVTREVRVMGNIRGYMRRPQPPVDVLVIAGDDMARARAQRKAAGLATGGAATTCAPGDGDALRRALARTGERYLLLADANALPDRAGLETLMERVERSGRVAVAFPNDAAPFDAALFHRGRIVNAQALAGETVAEVVTDLRKRLPERRLFAATPAREIVPPQLPVLPGLAGIDAIFIAASKPIVTQQTITALMAEPIEGTLTVVYPAGAATAERLLGVYTGLRMLPDDSDVQLAVGLNRALGASTADGIAIVRDDAQLPHGALARLKDAFRRIPRLGVAVPRLGGVDRPESVPDLGYRNSAEMQAISDRRAETFAREANLLDVATSPVLIVSREVLEVVGGFDERFGFSRLGVEDFTRRVRAANFLLACCDDAYAHLFPAEDAASFVGNLDNEPFLREVYTKRWSVPHGFDPETDRVPLRTDAAPAARAERVPLRILLPLRDEEEWKRVRHVVADLALAFRVNDPVHIAVGLDGTFPLKSALAALREILIAANAPMEETLNVSVDFVPDIAAWRAEAGHAVRIAGAERDDLDDVPAVDGAAAVRAALAELPA
jgi:hypothetical protein